MKGRRRYSVAALPGLLLGLLAPLPALAGPAAPLGSPAVNELQEQRQRFHGVWSAGGMVAAQEPLAAAAGVAVLRQGGNAVDAAVATAFALAVTHPQAGNLGGGGFLVLWLPERSPAAARGCAVRPRAGEPAPELLLGRGVAVAVNFRETAPLAATPTMFQRPDGTVDRQRASRSLQSTAVPGSVAGLLLAQRCYGRLSRERVLAPAIRLAEQGFAVSRPLSDSLGLAGSLLQDDPTSRRLFFRAKAAGPALPAQALSVHSLPAQPLAPGEILRQPELARTLRHIARLGEDGFYRGPVAAALLALMRARGGLIEAADLQAYRPRLLAPLRRDFRGHPVLAMPLPGGGVSLLQLLALLEPLPLEASGHGSAATLHLLTEAMNLVFRDRNARLGDPETTPIQWRDLLEDSYLEGLRRSLDPVRHRPSATIAAAPPPARGGTNTTHVSVADRQGGLVALTTTLNFSYGNGVAVPGAGFLLNNEMDDFSAAPGSANAFGLVQGAANAIAPGRRPLSSMTPTLVFRPDGTPWLATGSPGGSRIVTTVAQVLLARIVHGLNLATAVASPRIHSQLWPDEVLIEQGIGVDTTRLLEARGHRLRAAPAMGAANSVELLPHSKGSLGVSDPRRAEGPAQGE
jgi:gamma-glutamyltranspeptidase/glutathione hydrolase